LPQSGLRPYETSEQIESLSVQYHRHAESTIYCIVRDALKILKFVYRNQISIYPLQISASQKTLDMSDFKTPG